MSREVEDPKAHASAPRCTEPGLRRRGDTGRRRGGLYISRCHGCMLLTWLPGEEDDCATGPSCSWAAEKEPLADGVRDTPRNSSVACLACLACPSLCGPEITPAGRPILLHRDASSPDASTSTPPVQNVREPHGSGAPSRVSGRATAVSFQRAVHQSDESECLQIGSFGPCRDASWQLTIRI